MKTTDALARSHARTHARTVLGRHHRGIPDLHRCGDSRGHLLPLDGRGMCLCADNLL